LVRPVLLRPYLVEPPRSALVEKQRVAVIDPNRSYGFGGVLWGAARTAPVARLLLDHG